MNFLRKTVLPIFAATIWISISEFARNEFPLKSHWVNHYESLGLIFPSEPVNGAMWGIWSLAFAIAIFIIKKRFNFWETVILSWFVGFVLMWLVAGNMGVLPLSILPLAIPLSFIETFFATWIIKKLS